MKVIIAGSRDITGIGSVWEAIDGTPWEITEVVSGGARGPDSNGEKWAESSGIPVKKFPADWDKYGKGAGIVRNGEMAAYADALIAIWDGKSKGTLHMICDMVAKKKPVYVYCP